MPALQFRAPAGPLPILAMYPPPLRFDASGGKARSMGPWEGFVRQRIAAGARPAEGVVPPRIATYTAIEAEYEAITRGTGLVDRTDRALLEVRGRDRATWLHNLTTNQVKSLSPGEGNYAYAVNVQGRILFDLNIVVRPDSIWIDLDRGHLDRAVKHFAKYTVTEDVTVTDRTGEFVRFGLAGEMAKALLAELGAPQAGVMPWFATSELRWSSLAIPVLRHDFCGPFAVELFAPPERAVELWQGLTEHGAGSRAVSVGDEAVEIRRIEAGLPRPFHEITDEYLPGETGQSSRAVSHTKGCYLGQEVVERMRSRGVVARQLVGLRVAGDAPPTVGTKVTTASGEGVGVVTSSCRSVALAATIALGYVKAAHAAAGTRLHLAAGRGTVDAVVVELPFVPVPS